MLNMVAHMTKAEKKQLAQNLNDYTQNCKVDEEAVWQAIKEYDLAAGDVIHFNMLKCELLSHMNLPIYPLTPENYRDICAERTEEERRHKLCEILSQKSGENKMTEEKEPVMPIVAEADNDTKNQGLAVERLRSLLERIERLESEKSGISADIRDIYAEAKSAGFDPKIMRQIIKLRKMKAADRDEQEYLLETYKRALGI